MNKISLTEIGTSLTLLAALAFISGCAERKPKLWIDPPLGAAAHPDSSDKKLYYQVEDKATGKKHNLVIPIDHNPENLVIEQRKSNAAGDSDVTSADAIIQSGKLPLATATGGPEASSSYLRALTRLEALYDQAKYSEALIQITPMIEQYPKQARLHVMQGTLFKRVGEVKLAIKAYQEAARLEPENLKLKEAILKLEIGGNRG
ncbi:MAG: hypothetical protein AAB425_09695 [Bdellovibrionota bacterium]